MQHRTTRAALAAATLITAAVAAGSTAAPAQAAAASQAKPRTALTVAVAGCEGCTVQLQQTLPGPVGRRTWTSKAAAVTGGAAVLDVPTKRTFGGTLLLEAPWEGNLGYTTTVVMRYAGKAPGDAVTPAEAAASRRANACWEGVRARKARLDVAVQQVTVPGVQGPVTGTRAWLPTTTVWTGDTRRAPQGVLGTQDPDVCGD